MKLLFWKKTPMPEPEPRRSWNHHQLMIEKDGEIAQIGPQELERRCRIIYNPQLDFLKKAQQFSVMRKTMNYHEKGLLDPQQMWLGAYFQKEIDSLVLPPVRLKWISDAIGWGVFAERDLKPMEFIGEYAGRVRRKMRSDKKNAYCFQYTIVNGDQTPYTVDAMDQGGLTRFINHSDHPNLKSALATLRQLSHVILFVSRPIQKGEQLCYDYGIDYWKKRGKPQNFTFPV